ncbi:hypothetical protein [Acidianus ambivalens]|uniref:Uncharacterized protein n=1 Tax=Acidianus ambivalens TaxID=2283 RepID=A0A650CUH8_ACIAM|nr:hypothetical protein [Acidianus ambivalens]MQL56156.1 hypothetical protein [Acidianus ambivalens]QGR21302.1 hypothetical protein D1866_04305 [Acidianus ambivalens]
MYRNEIVINAGRSSLLGVLTNPFFISGIVGHVGILRVKDKQKGDYVTPEFLNSPEDDFQVAYVFGTPENYNVSLGYMVGPEIFPGEVKYKGGTFDGKFEWEVSFFLTPIDDNKTRLSISVNAKYKTSMLARIFGRSEFDLAFHIVEGHFIPFFKFYFKPSEEIEVNKIEIASEEGEANEVIAKFKEIVPKLEAGMIKISGKNLECLVIVINKDIRRVTCLAGNDLKTGSDALSLLLLYNGELKMKAYQLQLEDLIEKIEE